ncbi:MAG TPA: transcription antitermination factor NusB [Clostridia bacterium]|nr:transcription antitermination factor NusB [Clostridia bacterium]
MSRKTAREVAMKLAFAALLGGEDTYDAVLDKSGIDERPTPDDMEYSKAILDGILLHCDEIDALIHELAIGWKLERMPKVDLSILRVAIYEMMYREDIPCSVSINEAVELAKQFGGDRSSAYINGMLGTLAKRFGERQEG